MAHWITDGPADTELCRAELPDGSEMVIAVKAGLSQEEVDLLAAQAWGEVPEPGAAGE